MSGEIVLVTGASGYIASHIVQQLLIEGYRVRGTVRNLTHTAKVDPLRELVPNAMYPLELIEADLMDTDSWKQAVRGCRYVIHVASPVIKEEPENEDDVIKPAVSGTLNVLEAAKSSKSVRRVVLTSSLLAINNGFVWDAAKTYTEQDWTDPYKPDIGIYPKSKALAEKAAWEFVSQEACEFDLTVMNPALVFGPDLISRHSLGSEVVKTFLERQYPIIPPSFVPYIDVRDVARCHIVGMTSPKAANKRYLLCTHGLWYKDICHILREEFAHQGYNPPSYVAPKWFFWLCSFVDKRVAMILPMFNKKFYFDNSLMIDDLEIRPTSVRESLVDMAYSMIENGLIAAVPACK